MSCPALEVRVESQHPGPVSNLLRVADALFERLEFCQQPLACTEVPAEAVDRGEHLRGIDLCRLVARSAGVCYRALEVPARRARVTKHLGGTDRRQRAGDRGVVADRLGQLSASAPCAPPRRRRPPWRPEAASRVPAPAVPTSASAASSACA